MLEAGKQFSLYTIKEIISETDTHTCCLTEDPFFSRTLLIKLYPVEFSQNKQQCEEFEAGLEQLFHLEHPSIAPIFDSGFAENYFLLHYQLSVSVTSIRPNYRKSYR